MPSLVTRSAVVESSSEAQSRRTAFVAVTTLFFMWGFLTVLNDILVPHFKRVFDLDYFHASLIQFTFFGAYFIMAIPAGFLVAMVGYKRGLMGGLLIGAVGTLTFLPAAMALSYPIFLAALFILATGITVLQVAANPYIAALGRPETASSRLNLAQAFNSLGTTVAPWLGGMMILSASGLPAATLTEKMLEVSYVKLPYLGLTAILVLLAVAIGFIPLPTLKAVEEEATEKGFGKEVGRFAQVLAYPHLTLGALGIFLYVGAEVSIGSYLINYLGDPQIAGLTPAAAAKCVSLFWGGAMVGRFIGSGLLQFVRAPVLLGIVALLATLLCATGFAASGMVAMGAVLAIGLMNSIMFPTIFTLGIDRLGHLTSQGSSLLVMAIVGGAIVPVLMGHMADRIGIHHSLFVPAICYLYITYYALHGSQIGKAPETAQDPAGVRKSAV
jgi:FHS family L-fucose permease-like MFS transporter